MSSVVLISDLLYQSAGIVFLDGGRVSLELVMVSLTFHLFVVGTVIFASVLLCPHTSQYTINTKHNHHYSHDTSSSLELSQSMPKLISATDSYWNGRIPVAISNFSEFCALKL